MLPQEILTKILTIISANLENPNLVIFICTSMFKDYRPDFQKPYKESLNALVKIFQDIHDVDEDDFTLFTQDMTESEAQFYTELTDEFTENLCNIQEQDIYNRMTNFYGKFYSYRRNIHQMFPEKNYLFACEQLFNFIKSIYDIKEEFDIMRCEQIDMEEFCNKILVILT